MFIGSACDRCLSNNSAHTVTEPINQLVFVAPAHVILGDFQNEAIFLRDILLKLITKRLRVQHSLSFVNGMSGGIETAHLVPNNDRHVK